jgi:hypothetical protein
VHNSCHGTNTEAGGDVKQRIYLIFPLAILLIPFSTCLYAGDLHIIKEKHVTVVFDPSLRSAAQDVADMFLNLKANLEREIGWDLNLIPSVLLMKDRKLFKRMSESPLTVAFAVPARNLVVIDYTRMLVRPFSLEITLKHELCHLLLHHHIRGHDFPRWLDEGV